jgi:myo-inositol 2-dehydrogenase/D-chiro-inositol 1-dehydrogenase
MSLRLGVIGAGFGMRLIQTAISMPEFTLVAVADRNRDRDLSTLGKDASIFQDGVELIEMMELDALIVALPPHTRSDIVRVALARGLPVFLEKPLTGTVGQGRDLVELVRAQKTPVMMGFSFRFHPVIARARALIDGELGAPILANGEYVFNWQPAADNWLWDRSRGGGFFNENSCHLFDVICHLIGRPVEVQTIGNNYRAAPDFDAAAVLIRFDNGCVATCTVGGVGVSAHRHFPRLDLHTQNGRISLEGRDHMWTGISWASRDGTALSHVDDEPERLSETRFSSALRHFANSVQTGAEPASTVEDGLRSVLIAEAVYKSLESGQPIAIDDI